MLSLQAIQHDGQPALRLDGALTIYTAALARREVPERLRREGVRVLDLSGLEELDTAGAQLLYWLKRESEVRGIPLLLAHHSPAVLEVLGLLNLAATFGDPILLSPTAS